MRSIFDGSVVHKAEPSSHAVLFCGCAPADRFEELISIMQEEAAKRKKQAKDEKGFNRTPAFICAGGWIVQHAFLCGQIWQDAAW